MKKKIISGIVIIVMAIVANYPIYKDLRASAQVAQNAINDVYGILTQVQSEVDVWKNEVKEEFVPTPVSEPVIVPENLQDLVGFMKDTGGTVEDYVRLNADYSKTDPKVLLQEYYAQTKPHLDKEEI